MSAADVNCSGAVEVGDAVLILRRAVLGEAFPACAPARGELWTWGSNRHGQLGDGTVNSHSAPAPVSYLTGATAVAAGGSHSLAVRSDGTAWAWGSNGWVQLGDGTGTNRSTPAQVKGLSNVSLISGGGSHSIAMRLSPE